MGGWRGRKKGLWQHLEGQNEVAHWHLKSSPSLPEATRHWWWAETQTPTSFLLSLENTAKFPSQERGDIHEDRSTHMYDPLPRRIPSLTIFLPSAGPLPAFEDEQINAERALGTGHTVSASMRHESDP